MSSAAVKTGPDVKASAVRGRAPDPPALVHPDVEVPAVHADVAAQAVVAGPDDPVPSTQDADVSIFSIYHLYYMTVQSITLLHFICVNITHKAGNSYRNITQYYVLMLCCNCNN